MGLKTIYFAASSDAEAAETIDHVGGPNHMGQSSRVSTVRRSLLRRRAATHGGPSVAPLERAPATVSGGGIDPIVQMGTLQELLTGQDYDELMDARSGDEFVAERDGGALVVVRLAETLVKAIAEASDGKLGEVAVAWSQTEEFWDQGDPQILTGLLRELQELGLTAQKNQQKLYCWLSV